MALIEIPCTCGTENCRVSSVMIDTKERLLWIRPSKKDAELSARVPSEMLMYLGRRGMALLRRAARLDAPKKPKKQIPVPKPARERI